MSEAGFAETAARILLWELELLTALGPIIAGGVLILCGVVLLGVYWQCAGARAQR